MEIVYDPSLKKGICFLCELPLFWQKRGLWTIRDNELWICPDCLENKDKMEKLKEEDQQLYEEIVEFDKNRPPRSPEETAFYERLDRMESYKENGETKHSVKNDDEINFDHIRIHDGCSQWLTKLTIDELRVKAKEFCKPDPPKGIEINGKPIHENRDVKLLEDGALKEIFMDHPEGNIQVSNFGRIKCDGEILEQYDPYQNDKWKCGYLYVRINGKRKPKIEKLVYKLVAETWLKKPVNDWRPSDNSFNYNTVHHITNNGYDNRIENLMWVTKWQHTMIHPYIKIDDLSIFELICLINSYRKICITQDDYQRILDIGKRGYQLVDDEYKNFWLEDIIIPFEKLMKKHISKEAIT